MKPLTDEQIERDARVLLNDLRRAFKNSRANIGVPATVMSALSHFVIDVVTILVQHKTNKTDAKEAIDSTMAMIVRCIYENTGIE